MHWVASMWLSMLATNCRSGLLGRVEVFHAIGVPVPLGNATTKPACSASGLKLGGERLSRGTLAVPVKVDDEWVRLSVRSRRREQICAGWCRTP